MTGTIPTTPMTGTSRVQPLEASPPRMTSTASMSERKVAMPTAVLMWAVVASALLVAGGWATAIAIGPWGMSDFSAGMAGIGIATAAAIAGVFVISPWKPRAMIDWMTMWLAATVFRLFVTPIAAYLLYSAASSALAAKPFWLAVAVTYLATLFVEAAVLARHVNAICDSSPAIDPDRTRQTAAGKPDVS